ncbi:MAG: orotate phosphoribosyltransferase [Melioribacteraceae bacterium]|nr:orotate phosphoribosyltransferase [Melioribacteraceae bacterium]
MTKEELGKKIFAASHITGEFLLRSGQISNEYFDKYLFESDPQLLNEITVQLINLLPSDTEIIAGLEMGGIPIATMLSSKSGHPAIYVRKKAKEYGTRKLAEGNQFAGKKVTVIEDVVTTGGQIITSVNELRELGAVIDKVMCVIVRDPKAYQNLSSAGLTLLPLFTMDELKKIA